MITYDDYIQNCQDLCSDSSSSTLAFIIRVGNQGYKRAMRMFGNNFINRTQTSLTVASQQYYQLPSDYAFARSVKVTTGNLNYPLEEVKSQEEWDLLNRTTNIQTAIPSRYFIRLNQGIVGDEVGIWPTPSSSSSTITLVYEAIPRDVGNLKYTTGTVTLTNNSVTVTGSGTSWTSAMNGRYFQGTDQNGDGMWYRVQTVQSTTSLVLQNYYEGTTVAGATYQIAELLQLPEEAQMIPAYYTAWHFYLSKQNGDMAQLYKGLHDTEFLQMKQNNSAKAHGNVIRRGATRVTEQAYPYFFPTNIT